MTTTIVSKSFRPTLRRAACVLAVAISGGLHAADYCVTTGAQLTSALAAAQSNSAGDTIKIVEGTLTSAAGSNQWQWTFQPSESDADKFLRIVGGYEAGCATVEPPNGVSATTLDAQNRGPVFVFSDSSISEWLGQVSLKNFTATRGFATNTGFASAINLSSYKSAGSASFEIERLLVVAATSTRVNRGTVHLGIAPSGSVRAKGNILHANWTTGSGASAGLDVYAAGSAFGLVINNTIFDNAGIGLASGLSLAGVLTVANNAVAENTPSTNTLAQVYAETATGLSLSNNHFQTVRMLGTPSSQVGTTTGDPKWTITGSYPVAQAFSPLRDSGTNSPLTGLTTVDIRNNARIVNGVVDRGAVEAAVVPSTGPIITPLSPAASGSATSLGSFPVGGSTSTQITFTSTGGFQGSTSIACTSDRVDLQITANANQIVNAGATPLAVMLTWSPIPVGNGGGISNGVINCVISPLGSAPYNLNYGFGVIGMQSPNIFANSFD